VDTLGESSEQVKNADPPSQSAVTTLATGGSDLGHGLARRIRSLLPSLIPSEARVAEALLAAAPAIPASVAELAADAQTSPATVVRACQSLGFGGFNELSDALRREQQAAASTPRTAPDAERALRRTYEAGIQQLESAARTLDVEAFAAAVDTLLAARRVLVATSSDLAMLAQYATIRFAMVGRPVEAPGDVVAAHIVATGLAPGDVCLAFGSSGANMLTVRIAQAAATAGATNIAVTAFPRGPLAELADLHLAAGVPTLTPSERDYTRICVSQLLVIDALQAAMRDRGAGNEIADTVDGAMNAYTYRRSRHEGRTR
jgi:RpiR family transcriptional regulator, carbohydrate utilization regulator